MRRLPTRAARAGSPPPPALWCRCCGCVVAVVDTVGDMATPAARLVGPASFLPTNVTISNEAEAAVSFFSVAVDDDAPDDDAPDDDDGATSPGARASSRKVRSAASESTPASASVSSSTRTASSSTATTRACATPRRTTRTGKTTKSPGIWGVMHLKDWRLSASREHAMRALCRDAAQSRPNAQSPTTPTRTPTRVLMVHARLWASPGP
mmetsp:Transcript_2984/g.11358  ORF Transcript_2984/g.11358 Transcript_2984/m.11358 type:complete len:209 (+) Transcript_2984:338-964(+)